MCHASAYFQSLQRDKYNKIDIGNNTQKYLLYKQFVAWHCKGYTNALLSDYINNPIFQELPLEKNYFAGTSDERIYIDLRDSQDYKDEIEKPSRNGSKLTAMTELKAALA